MKHRNHREMTQTATAQQIDSHRAAEAGSLHGARAASGSQFDNEDSDTDDMYSDHSPNGNHQEEEEKKEEDMINVNEAGSVNGATETDNVSTTAPRAKSNEIVDIPKQRHSRKLTDTQMMLVSAATKYALLCGSTVLFLDLQFLCQAISNLGKDRYGLEVVLEIWFWFALLLMFYTIYLSFPTTMQQYDNVCGRLHSALERVFMRNMKSEIARKEAEQNNQAKSVCCCRLNQAL